MGGDGGGIGGAGCGGGDGGGDGAVIPLVHVLLLEVFPWNEPDFRRQAMPLDRSMVLKVKCVHSSSAAQAAQHSPAVFVSACRKVLPCMHKSSCSEALHDGGFATFSLVVVVASVALITEADNMATLITTIKKIIALKATRADADLVAMIAILFVYSQTHAPQRCCY